MEISRAMKGKWADSEQNSNIQPKKKTKRTSPQSRWRDERAFQEDGTG
jgi:hypothetical protein